MAKQLIEDTRRETAHLLWQEEWGFYRPDYTRALSNVLPTMYELMGAPLGGFPTMTHALPAATPRSIPKVMLLTMDSLGYKEFAESERFTALYEQYGTWITSVFPSITSCALTSLYQGLPPARHGILGHEIWKDFPGAVVDMLRMAVQGARAPLVEAGFDLQQWKQEPGLLDLESAQALTGYHLMPYRIVSSGLSLYTYGHAQRMGYADFYEGLTKAARMLTEMERGWVSLYHAVVDTLAHVLGGEHPAVGLAVNQVEQALTWMAGQVPRQVADETLLVVLADHGQTTTQHSIPLYGEKAEWLSDHTKAVGYSGRVMHVYLGDYPAGPVVAWLQELIGDAGLVLPFDQVAHLAGEGHNPDWVRQSLGDLVVLLRDGWNWDKRRISPEASPYESRLVSQHGALGWDEMFIPMLAAPLSALL